MPEYQASLSHMIYYYGSVMGSASYGKGCPPAGKEEEFVISCDISGHTAFTNLLGVRWPEGSLPIKVAIQCDQGLGMWSFLPSSP